MTTEPSNEQRDILIVDDTQQNLVTLKRILTEQGYKVRPAINGTLALQIAQKALPDLILLDIRMPGMDGYEVCHALKTDTATRNIPVLFLSALDDADAKLKAFEIGGVDYITKPFQVEEVIARVEAHLALRSMQQQLQENADELARMNAALTRQTSILDTFIKTVPDVIYFKDRDSRILQVNQAFADWFELQTSDEIVGKTDFDLFPSDIAREKYQQEQAIIETGTPLINREEQRIEPDGKTEWVLTTKMPLYDEHRNIIGIFGISRNITALKEAEQELTTFRQHLEDLVEEKTQKLQQMNHRLQQEIDEHRDTEQSLQASERQYRLLAEKVSDGIVILVAENIVFVNAAFSALIGYPAEELLDKHFLQLLPEKDRCVVHENLLHERRKDDIQQLWQVDLVTKKAGVCWIEVSQAQMTWEGEPALLLTIGDITNRKLREMHFEEERARLRQENLSLKATLTERYKFGELVGKSVAMQRVYELITSTATSEVNTLVVGESGTGKELIARTIHHMSARRKHAFVPVNCASIPDTLFEREFFGHRKGAFTGADRDKPGLFDRAHQGVLFLDEVTELDPGMQAKLLRVLQDGEYLQLGSNTPKQADVLIVAATNKDPKQLIAEGRLRQDFFYRICVIELQVPPLKDRKEDLSLLLEHFLAIYCQKLERLNKNIPDALPSNLTDMPGELIQALYAYDWPGNVRELQNVLQRYLATGDLTSIFSQLSFTIGASHDVPAAISYPSASVALSDAMEHVEKQFIEQALADNWYHIGKTAKRLGVSFRTLQRKIKRHHLMDER